MTPHTTLELVSLVTCMCAAGACAGSDAQPVARRIDTSAALVADTTQSAPTSTTGIEFHSAAELARVGDELAKGSSTARTVSAHPGYHFVEARRSSTGVPEIHDAVADLTIVQAGRATLLTGGRVDGGKLVSAGEHRGGTIVGGTTRQIAAGDLFIIPAKVPHEYQVARGDSIRYLTIKTGSSPP
jgi:hypothetical protein